MKKLTSFFKQLRLSQLFTAFLATVVLFVSTACGTNSNLQGARPDNPAVQAGGMNNPHKAGGDTNTNYSFSPDPKVNSRAAQSNPDRADLQIISDRLIAASQLQYPAGSEIEGSPADEQHALPIIDQDDFKASEPGGQIQRESNIGDRIKDRLSTVKETFDEASEFIGEGAKEASQQEINAPKTTKANFR